MRLFLFACPVTILAAVAQIFAEDCGVTHRPIGVNVRHLEGEEMESMA